MSLVLSALRSWLTAASVHTADIMLYRGVSVLVSMKANRHLKVDHKPSADK